MRKLYVWNNLTFCLLLLLLISCKSLHDKSFGPILEGRVPRAEILFDFGWKFHYGDIENGEKPDLDVAAWRPIDLPHDWSIEDLPGKNSPFDSLAIGGIDAGYLVGGTSWYRKEFEIPSKLKGRKFRIDFEGVYMNADIWLNGEHLGNHPYGYSEFGYEISGMIRYGKKNIMAVEVKNEGKNSRWFTGSGIYRHVWLTITNPVHIDKWGTTITTSEVSPSLAKVTIMTEVFNESKNVVDVSLVMKVLNKEGQTLVVGNKENQNIKAGEKKTIVRTLDIASPELWSIDSPELYTAITEIFSGKNLVDKNETKFGIRKIEFTQEGFFLNGKNVLLKGGCMHHDNGPLGAAAYDRAEERRVELMKASGFNSIRCAHNPPSTAFLDACDQNGILVIDETFDMWRLKKNPQDYHLYFDDWWQKDVDAMVLRDRNHPSVFMWSIGNEIPERGKPEGVETAKMLVDYIKKIDATRPITSAVNGLGPDKDPYFATLDIAGYNYSFEGDLKKKSIFETDHSRVPDRLMICTESFPLTAFGAWMEVIDYPFLLGNYVWTGFDYLGEASIGWRGYPHDESFYPWNHAYCGDIDICGFKRPQSSYRDILWNNGKQLSIFVRPPVPSFPVKANRAAWSKWHWQDVVPEWNWEGFINQPLDVEVYCSFEQVELFLNGESLGKKETNRSNQWIARWKVPFKSGELKAVGYKGNQEVVTELLRTAREPAQISLSADRTQIISNGQDLSYITVDLVDSYGLRHPKTDKLVKFEITGPGEILAVASSNPVSIESFRQPQRKSYKGRCLVVVKSTREAGEILLKASADGLAGETIKLVAN